MANQEGPNAFSVFISQLADGAAHSELSGELHELAKVLQDAAVTQAGTAKGELMLKLKLAIEPNGITAITYELTTKKPKAKRPSAVAWLSKGLNVVFQNPKQTIMPFRDVSAPAEAREVTETTATAIDA
jgi:hypothetical protein